ncbi:uroporphyrin-III C-methyltransferase [Tistrella bauzanensis]|uniref:uroporphyrinogen-III C-methyltransferase n=1 Tax=Tistrella bauzanensis TaxID=657419 RepID=A0ABQ1IBK6_9PROT|nr:uroporphyrinogen-III C-methyltransferase [Tistrella bauzanensis]GGB30079.1 uroporphyrin-III C-methyltransferase [Tistrella bauzanensis]
MSEATRTSVTLPGFLGLPIFQPGWVWLVGAGPGDPALLTLGAAHALASADVVVYDALVDERILALAGPDAQLEYAGKRGGRPSPKQADITLRIIDLARQGKRVLRLKGGDPFVFGRGGEEGLALVEAGIPFRVIPGVTAGIGGSAYAGIPVTHRDTNHVVSFITGHDTTGGVTGNIEWEALAKGSPVIVLYMGLKHLGEIATRLMAGGRDPDEPVAVIARATTPAQRVLETTVSRAEADVAASGIEAPAIVVMGPVVRLRAALDWLGALDGRALTADPLGTRHGQKKTGS